MSVLGVRAAYFMQFVTVFFAQPERLSMLLQRIHIVKHEVEAAVIVNTVGAADKKALELRENQHIWCEALAGYRDCATDVAWGGSSMNGVPPCCEFLNVDMAAHQQTSVSLLHWPYDARIDSVLGSMALCVWQPRTRSVLASRFSSTATATYTIKLGYGPLRSSENLLFFPCERTLEYKS
jgi:hypothetical protein